MAELTMIGPMPDPAAPWAVTRTTIPPTSSPVAASAAARPHVSRNDTICRLAIDACPTRQHRASRSASPLPTQTRASRLPTPQLGFGPLAGESAGWPVATRGVEWLA